MGPIKTKKGEEELMYLCCTFNECEVTIELAGIVAPAKYAQFCSLWALNAHSRVEIFDIRTCLILTVTEEAAG